MIIFTFLLNCEIENSSVRDGFMPDGFQKVCWTGLWLSSKRIPVILPWTQVQTALMFISEHNGVIRCTVSASRTPHTQPGWSNQRGDLLCWRFFCNKIQLLNWFPAGCFLFPPKDSLWLVFQQNDRITGCFSLWAQLHTFSGEVHGTNWIKGWPGGQS